MNDIKHFRHLHGLTQRQCADMIYITERQWRNIESGKTPLSRANLALLTLLTDSSINFRNSVISKLKFINGE